MASRFWVGGTGTWDASDTTHWAATSGGTGGETVPTSSDTVTFDSNSGTAATVTIATNAAVASTVTINKSDLTLLCNHTLTVSGAVTFTAGTLNTNGQTMTWGNFDSSNSNTRTLTLGSSAITLSSTGTAWSAETVTNLTVTANTATVTLTGAGCGFVTGAQDWNGLSVVMSGSGVPYLSSTSGATVANFTRTGTAVKTDGLQSINGPLTVTGTFTVTGNSATNRLLVYSSALGTARTITAAAVSLTNVDFRDITGAGAATWSGTSIGNALGNTGITFTTPVTRYAVATGNVSGTGTWSDAPGGASGASVPLCHDTIVLNAASGAITVTNDMPRLCADLTCTGFTGTLTLTTGPEIQGSVTLGSGMTMSGTGATTLRGRSTHTFTTNGVTWKTQIQISAPSGTYTLGSAITINRDDVSVINLIVGSFSDGGFSVSFTGATFGNYRQDGGTATLSGVWTIAASTGVVPPWYYVAGTLTHTGSIILSAATATDRTFAGGGQTYGTLTDQNTSTGKLTITGANTFGTLSKTAAAACTLALPTSSGITVTGLFAVTGVSGAVLTLTGDVTKAEGTVSCDYLAISSSDATGGAYFYAGANSTDGGTNTGWIFGAPTGGRPYKGGTATVKESDIEGALVIL